MALEIFDLGGLEIFDGKFSVDLETKQNIKFDSGTAYTMTLDHAATAARTITIPDATDTVCLLAATQELDAKTLDSSVAKGTWTASGTWTIPAVTLGGVVNVNTNNLDYVRNIDASYTDQYLDIYGGAVAAGGGSRITLTGVDKTSDTGLISIITPDAAGTGNVTRLSISGKIATAVATWTSTTHTGLVITSAGLVEGAGTGANGFKIKNPKNAAASALSGTQLDVEIDIGGTPYYFTVYPTKA